MFRNMTRPSMLGPWMLLLGTLILSSGCKKPGDLPAGPDAATGAKTTATTGATAVEKKFKVAISTRPGQWNLDERVRGYKETFEKEYPEIEVVAEIDDETKYEVGTREASAVLEKFQDLAGFAGINAASGPGVAKAVENAGRSGKVVVVAMDADSPVLDAIEAGTIQASVAQRQYYMTYLGVKYLYGLKHKLLRAPDDQSADSRLPAIAAEVDTGTVEVTKENVVVFRTPSQGAKEDIKKTHPEWVRLLSDRKVVGDTSNEEYVVIGISTLGLDGSNFDAELLLPRVLKDLPIGLKGLFIAIMLAALMSTVSAMVNLLSAVVINDFVRRYIAKNSTEKELVRVGQLVTALALIGGFLVSLSFTSVVAIWELTIFVVVTMILVPATMRWHWWRFGPMAFVYGMAASALAAIGQKV
ncbi:MAG TPA: substrate-binding domain-containing protein, partial [Armatimonadota bacterium]|nr:substrate-binding domain-containing protein [Armatimonadota bacterium]